MQTHWVEKLMSYANLMRILCRKGIVNEADPVSRRPDFLSSDNLIRPDESLYGMEKCMTLILMVMAMHYCHYQHWEL